MKVFALPKRLCKEIVALMSRFWWGYGENEKEDTIKELEKDGDDKN